MWKPFPIIPVGSGSTAKVVSPPLTEKLSKRGDWMATAFQRWVARNGGPSSVAAKLCVSKFSVEYWLRQRGAPQVDTILKIIRLSKGELTSKQIIESTHPDFKKGR